MNPAHFLFKNLTLATLLIATCAFTAPMANACDAAYSARFGAQMQGYDDMGGTACKFEIGGKVYRAKAPRVVQTGHGYRVTIEIFQIKLLKDPKAVITMDVNWFRQPTCIQVTGQLKDHHLQVIQHVRAAATAALCH